MPRIQQALLWLPALLLLHGAAAEVYAKKCSEKTVKAAFDSGMSADMVASICPKYKETLVKMSEGASAIKSTSSSATKSSQAVQATTTTTKVVKKSCSDQDKANMVLAGVRLEVIWKTCGKPAQTAQTTQAAAAVQAAPAVSEAPAPEPKPKKTRSRRSSSKEKAEPAEKEETEPAESASEQPALEMQHTLGMGLGLGGQTQFLLPYYFYHLDEQLVVGAQLRKMKDSADWAITGSGGYLWKWDDFRFGGQGYLGFGSGMSWGLEGLGFYDFISSLDLGLAMSLPFGSTGVRKSDDSEVTPELGFTMLAGYKF